MWHTQVIDIRAHYPISLINFTKCIFIVIILASRFNTGVWIGDLKNYVQVLYCSAEWNMISYSAYLKICIHVSFHHALVLKVLLDVCFSLCFKCYVFMISKCNLICDCECLSLCWLINLTLFFIGFEWKKSLEVCIFLKGSKVKAYSLELVRSLKVL